MELIKQSKSGCQTTVNTTDLLRILGQLECALIALDWPASTIADRFTTAGNLELAHEIKAFRNEVCSRII